MFFKRKEDLIKNIEWGVKMKSLILEIWQLQQSQIASQGMSTGRGSLPKSGIHKKGKKVVYVVLFFYLLKAVQPWRTPVPAMHL